jgi:hypothetical protein
MSRKKYPSGDPSDSTKSSIPLNSPVAHGTLLEKTFEASGIALTRQGIVPEHTKNEVLLIVGHKP